MDDLAFTYPIHDGRRPTLGRSFFVKPVAVLLLAAATVAAQQAPSTADDNEPRSTSVTLASQFFDHDFVNYFLFANGIYDTRIPVLQGSQSGTSGSFGYDVGGGVSAYHEFHDGAFSLSYRGDYRNYVSSSYGSGTDQNLTLGFSKRLSRHWSLSSTVAGGILEYGGGSYSVTPSAASSVISNPFSTQTRFADVSLSLAYQQTRRLSYIFGGNFYLNNYNYAGSINSIGGSGSASILYRLTARTSLAGTYSRTYYSYSKGVGQTTLDGLSVTLTHQFQDHWQASLSVGADRSHTSGIITIPVAILFGQQIVTGYETGPYDRVSYTPSVQATVTRYLRHSSLSFSGGQGVLPGNGTFLTSRDQFANATYSYSTRRSNISGGGGYFRLESIANNVSQSYSTANLSVSYGYTLRRYLSANVRYDYIHYGGLFSYGSLNESRFSFGLSLSSKSIPMTLF